MALRKCKECGNEVSTKADKCPNCDAPIRKKIKIGWIGPIIAVIMVSALTVGILRVGEEKPKKTDKPKKKNVATDTQEKKKKTVSESDWGEIRYAHVTTNIRASRSTKSKNVGTLKPGEKIKADFLSNTWFAVFRLDEPIRVEKNAIGYVYAPLLKAIPPSKTKTTKK